MSPTWTVPAQPEPRDVGSANLAGDRLRVLLVEDDAGDAFLVKELLDEAKAPITLTVASTLAQARERLAGVDCVLLDLGLPDAQGLDGLRRVLDAAPGAAVCVLTGLGDEHLGAAALGVGAQDYLIKGQVDGVLLARSVRYAVERKRADENARRLHEVELLQQESARLERGLLPQPLLNTQDLRVHTFYQPGRHTSQLGGDFFDVVQIGPERIAMMVGDVCGKGVDEAALGVELRVAWRALVIAGVADETVLAAVEQMLVTERHSPDIFVTMATVIIDLAQGCATVRLAGHPPPLLLPEGGAARAVPAAYGPVLGVFKDAQRPATTVPLEGDWALLMYTDGLIDGRTSDGGRLNVAGLQALIASPQAGPVPRGDLPGWLVAQAEEANGGPLADDVAMLLVSRPEAGR
jgi:serine phosphatase RsbU (regulator of sigma subunit)